MSRRALGEAEKLQRPLRWTAHHASIGLSEEGTVATTNNLYQSAMCGGHEMRRGRHYATFTLHTLGAEAFLGVVGAGFDPTTGAEANESSQGWVLSTFSGKLLHETDDAVFDRVVAVNLGGVFRCAKYALPHMMAGGGGANLEHKILRLMMHASQFKTHISDNQHLKKNKKERKVHYTVFPG